jgi:hypothetical protein
VSLRLDFRRLRGLHRPNGADADANAGGQVMNDIEATAFIEKAKTTMAWFFDTKVADAQRALAEKTEVLEKRVIAAEETSKAATAQMTAVLAVLNVLAKYAGPPKGKP